MFQISLQEWNFQGSDLISFSKMWYKLYHKKWFTDTREKDKTSYIVLVARNEFIGQLSRNDPHLRQYF